MIEAYTLIIVYWSCGFSICDVTTKKFDMPSKQICEQFKSNAKDIWNKKTLEAECIPGSIKK